MVYLLRFLNITQQHNLKTDAPYIKIQKKFFALFKNCFWHFAWIITLHCIIARNWLAGAQSCDSTTSALGSADLQYSTRGNWLAGAQSCDSTSSALGSADLQYSTRGNWLAGAQSCDSTTSALGSADLQCSTRGNWLAGAQSCDSTTSALGSADLQYSTRGNLTSQIDKPPGQKFFCGHSLKN